MGLISHQKKLNQNLTQKKKLWRRLNPKTQNKIVKPAELILKVQLQYLSTIKEYIRTKWPDHPIWIHVNKDDPHNW